MRVGVTHLLAGAYILLKDGMNNANRILNYPSVKIGTHKPKIETIILHAYYCDFLHK